MRFNIVIEKTGKLLTVEGPDLVATLEGLVAAQEKGWYVILA